MFRSDLDPPRTGPASDPVLYGIAAGLAELFPPVEGARGSQPRREAEAKSDSAEAADEGEA
ncbi:hypothetical protein [Methylobacterium planeticum]|uniref:Uncharacterized protein n=1 Tax=Methylobacterium planeticum TaxID=2615211 RepID=A0A6N6MWA4_9HYPH|nr:hypothetical protein [Methylobacterium planeticum]KAB1075542.1 hypothetical protein F6X51_02335 [Methylobacterium planeticum]